MLTTTSKEPPHARFTSDKVMIKDHYYYKGNGFSWSKPARVNEKNYPFFHKQQDDNKNRIENMRQQEIEDKRLYEEIRREKLIEKKAIHKSNFDSRIKEREVIQRMSNQPITSQNNLETEEDSKVAYEIVAKKLNSGKDLRSDEFSWNLLNRASKKNVEIYLGSYSLKGEEEMIKKLKERMEEEKLDELKEQRRRSEFHDKVRDIFIARHEGNLAKEESILRPATAKNPSFHIRKSKVQHYDHISRSNIVEGTKKGDQCASAAELRSNNNVTTPRSQGKDTKLSLAVSMERLAVSREGVRKEFAIDNTECKGMLVQNMDKKICLPGNNFYDALTQSKVFQEILEGNKSTKKDSSRKIGSRPATSMTTTTLQSRPMTSLPKQPSPYGIYSPSINLHSGLITPPSKNKLEVRSMSVMANDDYNPMSEINAFENTFCRGSKKVGYARVSLEEAYRLTSSQGLVALQRMESTKKQQLIK